MAKNTLPVDFKDDIMNSSMGGKRRYKMINNSDGTISLEDATTYDQVGSNFGASQLNATNQAVNAAADAGKIIDDLDAINNVTQEGYIAGARALKQVNDSLEELKTSDKEYQLLGTMSDIGNVLFDIPQNCKNLILYVSSSGNNLTSVFVPFDILINTGKSFSAFADGDSIARATVMYDNGKINLHNNKVIKSFLYWN